MSEELKSLDELLTAAKRLERHHTVAETRYWCGQYKQIACDIMLAALKAGKDQAITEVSAETFSSDGTSDIITCNLPIGTKLYLSAPPASADAVPVPRELLKELIDAAEYGTGINNHELIQARALLAQSESKGVK